MGDAKERGQQYDVSVLTDEVVKIGTAAAREARVLNLLHGALGPAATLRFPVCISFDGKQTIRQSRIRGVSVAALFRSIDRHFWLSAPSPHAFRRSAIAALTLMKAANIEHRDIRPENLLINGGGHVCVIDFGWAGTPDDLLPLPRSLGGAYRCPRGVNDDYSMGRVAADYADRYGRVVAGGA